MSKRKKKRAHAEHTEYTVKEIQLILDTPNKNLKDLAFLIGRTEEALRRKKWALLNMDRDRQGRLECKKRQQKESKKSASYNNTRWSIAEEKEVLEASITDRELAKRLGRTIASIQMKRNRLLKDKGD